MFTGIVAAVGRIERIESLGEDGGVRLTVNADSLGLDDVAVGDSISIEGACMTAVGIAPPRFVVEVSRESLSKTTGLDRPGEVNLEKALRLSDRLGGHLVAGHVDGLGEVTSFSPVGESMRLVILAPAALGRYLAVKGSITVNGVSLTVNRVRDVQDGTELEINLIPHTIEATTLKKLAPGDAVNLEVDLLARYVERMLDRDPRQG
jgi:riboflavin synthase